MEIRAGTGGDEASIFAGDLYRMYSKYFESKGWKASTTSFTEGTVGGYKEIIMNGNYEWQKFEAKAKALGFDTSELIRVKHSK